MEFEQFLDSELDALARYARAISGDREQAHDILAEAMIKTQKAWPRINHAENPVAYVRRIITNTLISQQRSWVSRHIFTTRTGELPDTAVAAGSATLETRDELDQRLRTLAPRQRAALVLRYYLDLDDEAIAAELQCSVSSVRSYISRGLSALRITYDRQDEHHG
ncbi:RNA polymerase sigma-70 factor, sigma-E family [Nakamurella panacisegetis]|uniref:RNA polymerase sigma-70 factor, sigma-E family n=1 Tax=Nakamurella panacisegetis TaxID=1090615 RepID=A0A1H0L3G5_9ACTN|nr:SigE family RNA polymerase sigma factor [Nakamurella panacisegetis]SDO62521.1 RNA polymerase sigma-70 factor, sigma-E family [Nakamurella panacisegetis]